MLNRYAFDGLECRCDDASGGGAHPGANACSVHAGGVMRGVLDFMRKGGTRRGAQHQKDAERKRQSQGFKN
jgi:hypothetical protein